jgi:hypothetical protein
MEYVSEVPCSRWTKVKAFAYLKRNTPWRCSSDTLNHSLERESLALVNSSGPRMPPIPDIGRRRRLGSKGWRGGFGATRRASRGGGGTGPGLPFILPRSFARRSAFLAGVCQEPSRCLVIRGLFRRF